MKRKLRIAALFLFVLASVSKTEAANPFSSINHQLQKIEADKILNVAAIKEKADKDKKKRQKEEQDAAEERRRAAEQRNLENLKATADRQVADAQRKLNAAELARTEAKIALTESMAKEQAAVLREQDLDRREKILQEQVEKKQLYVTVLGLFVVPAMTFLTWAFQSKKRQRDRERYEREMVQLDLQNEQLKQQLGPVTRKRK